MAATKASMASLAIQRARDGGKQWEAVAGKLIVATAMSLDTLVGLLTARHGGLCAIINTAHISRATEPERTPAAREKSTKEKRAQRARKRK